MYWKITKYLYIYEGEMAAVIFCTKNGCIMILSKEEADVIKQNQNKRILQTDLSEEMFQVLKMNKILIPEEQDELSDLIKSHERVIENSEKLHLTIFITDECNFDCEYCFVNKEKQRHLERSGFEQIVKYIEKNIRSYKGLSVSWFGGEPLERKEELVEYSTRLRELCMQRCVSYESSIVTNGYDLTLNTFQELYHAGIENYQVTFDGAATRHDKLRVHKTNGRTFQRIFNNLLDIKRVDDDKIQIRVRCNWVGVIDKEIEEFAELFQSSFADDDRFILQVRTIVDYDSEEPAQLLSIYANKVQELCQLSKKYDASEGFLIDRLYPKRIWCSTLNRHALVVSPDVKIYTCDSTMNNPKYCYAKIDEEGNLVKNPDFDADYFNEQLEEKCLNCKRFPLCFGSCQRIYHKVKKHACALSDRDIENLLEFILEKNDSNNG